MMDLFLLAVLKQLIKHLQSCWLKMRMTSTTNHIKNNKLIQMVTHLREDYLFQMMELECLAL